MKIYLFWVGLAGCLVFFSCRRSADIESYPLVSLNNCSGTTVNGKTVNICFDSVINDSRCPLNVVCGTAGYALVKMSLSVNGQKQSFRLATVNAPPYFRNDTTVLGHTIKLISLDPYPQNPGNVPNRAEVLITQ